MFRRTTAVLALTATVGLTVVASHTGQAAPSLTWTACVGEGIPDGMGCATLDVPVNWAKPGRKITLNLARAKHTGPEPRLGAVLAIPGGPGGSGIEDLKQSWNTFAELRRHFDVVSFAPRGSWASGHLPAACDEPDVQLTAPKTRAEFDQVVRENRAAVDRCRYGDPELYDRLDSVSHAHDIDAIRAALGEAELNALATSYGGVLATTYARQFPGRIRAMALDGIVDHVSDHRTDLRNRFERVERLFRSFVNWCAAAKECALHGQDVPTAWRELVARADREPIPAQGTKDRFDGSRLQIAAQPFLVTQKWQLLAEGIVKARAGDATVFGLPLGGRKPGGPANSVATECGDDLAGRYTGYGDYRRALAEGAQLSKNFPAVGVRALQCTDSPVPVRNPRQPLRATALPPFLGAYSISDGAGTEAVTAQVPGSVSVRTEDYGHGLYLTNQRCVIAHVNRYFVDGTLPAPDASCPKSS